MKTYRTLIVLFAAQSFGQTAAPVMVLLGGIVGAKIAPTLALATLPLAAMVIGTALTTVPASMLMSRYGRRSGFLGASMLSIASGLVAAWAVTQQNFWMFCFSAAIVGAFAAFLQQFRFAVAESVPVEAVPRSLSILMLAGVVAAFLGPELASTFSQVEGLQDYVGSYLAMSALLTVCFLILLLFYRNTEVKAESADGEVRSFSEILKSANLILAIVAAVVAWSIMTLVMTATPVAMHEIDQLSLEDTTWVIQSHIFAMYLPALFSGYLITWFGVRKIIFTGAVIMIAVVAVGYGNPHVVHYWSAMVLLGIGWNFLFVGGTTLLTQTYRDSERFKIQALNDFLVFGLQAFASLGAGVLLATLGWNGVMLFCVPWLVLLIPVLWIASRPAKG